MRTSPPSPSLERIQGIVQQIEKHLLELGRVTGEGRKVWVWLVKNPNIGEACFLFDHPDHFGDEYVQIDRFVSGPIFLRERLSKPSVISLASVDLDSDLGGRFTDHAKVRLSTPPSFSISFSKSVISVCSAFITCRGLLISCAMPTLISPNSANLPAKINWLPS